MTSTSFSIGLGEGARASSKVLKPPGGGSSDIFGSTEPDQSPRRVKTHMASNINLSDTTDSSSASSTASSDSPTPTSPGPRKDDANDIEHTPSSAAELQSETCGAALAEESAPVDSAPAEESAPVEESAAAAEQVSAESEQPVESAPVARKNHMQSNIVLGDDRPAEKKESGGESLQNGGGPKSNGAPVAPRTRVPPGGYSSGLW